MTTKPTNRRERKLQEIEELEAEAAKAMRALCFRKADALRKKAERLREECDAEFSMPTLDDLLKIDKAFCEETTYRLAELMLISDYLADRLFAFKESFAHRGFDEANVCLELRDLYKRLAAIPARMTGTKHADFAPFIVDNDSLITRLRKIFSNYIKSKIRFNLLPEKLS